MCTRIATSGLLKSIALLTIPLILDYQLSPSLLKHSHPYTNILYYLPSQSKHTSPAIIPFIYIASLFRRAVILWAWLPYYPVMLLPTSIRYFFTLLIWNCPCQFSVLMSSDLSCDTINRPSSGCISLTWFSGHPLRGHYFRYWSHEHNINSCSHAVYVEWEHINNCKWETSYIIEG